MHLEFKIEGGDFSKAGFASSEIKKVLKQLNIDFKIVKHIIVALYEAEVNIVAHAYKGIIYVDIDNEKVCIKLVDEGPGIADIELAMKEGYSTASQKVREMGFGAGMGLANIKKNTDKLNIMSELNKGTTIEFINFLK
jgi:anti-sigma regulatory factor (Ser/Thr protein kinase)